MTTPFSPFLQDAADQYAAQAVAAAMPAAIADRDVQIVTLRGQLLAQQALGTQNAAQLAAAQQQLATLQAQLATALAADAADRATVTACQRLIADLQAQLLALRPGKAPAPPVGYVEAFRDDMDGRLGPGWFVANNDSSSNELSLRLATNVVGRLGVDYVSILAKRQTVGSHLFTSGYLSTAGHCSVPFGRWLARMRWDDLFGLWPALWLRFDNAVGEIDGAEAVGTVRKLVQTAHQNTNGKMDKCGYEWAMPANWSPSLWHVYGVERRTDGAIIWTVDGVITQLIKPADLSTKLHQPMSWLTGPEYSGPAHLIINLQVGGSMPNYYLNGGQPLDPAKILPDGTPAGLDIDYVQVLTPLAGA